MSAGSRAHYVVIDILTRRKREQNTLHTLKQLHCDPVYPPKPKCNSLPHVPSPTDPHVPASDVNPVGLLRGVCVPLKPTTGRADLSTPKGRR